MPDQSIIKVLRRARRNALIFDIVFGAIFVAFVALIVWAILKG
jgi:hypothetical protein